MAWFLNFYRCDRCRRRWTDEWSCMCDDECPHCGARDMSPFDSENLTELVEQDGNEFVAIRSPNSAEHEPDYRESAVFRRARRHEEFLGYRLDVSGTASRTPRRLTHSSYYSYSAPRSRGRPARGCSASRRRDGPWWCRRERRRAAGALVALVLLGNGFDRLGLRFGHCLLRCVKGRTPAARRHRSRTMRRAMRPVPRPCIADAGETGFIVPHRNRHRRDHADITPRSPSRSPSAARCWSHGRPPQTIPTGRCWRRSATRPISRVRPA